MLEIYHFRCPFGVQEKYNRRTTQWMESWRRQKTIESERRERGEEEFLIVCYLALELEAEIRGIGSKLEQAKNKKTVEAAKIHRK